MKKTVIALRGKKDQGKSETIKLLRDIILSHHKVVEKLLIDDGDIKTIIKIGNIKIGIESQGDPKSRQKQSIDDFIKRNCEIIICTCRSSGETVNNLEGTVNHGYRLVWTTNYRSKEISHKDLNDLSAQHLLDLFTQILNGTL